MTEAEAGSAQARVFELAAELEALIAKLQDVHDGIPVSPSEAVMLAGEEDLDVATALRSMIECVLADRLGPALVVMRKEAAYHPPSKAGT